MTDDGWWVLPLGYKKLRTDPPDYPVILRQPSWSLLSTFISAEVVAAIRVAQTLRHTHGHTRTREPATHHHFRNTAPPLWQQNVPQLPLRPHPHLQPPLTKPTMIPMTIFYSWQVATAQRLTTDAHGPPTDNQTLPPPLSFGAATLSVSVSVSWSLSVSMSLSVRLSVCRRPLAGQSLLRAVIMSRVSKFSHVARLYGPKGLRGEGAGGT